MVDACFICTPHHLHTSIATQALENNIHTIVEKPLSNDYPSAKSFYDLANDSNLTTAIAFIIRYDNYIILIKQLIEDGLIGKIVGIRVKTCNYVGEFANLEVLQKSLWYISIQKPDFTLAQAQ